MKTETASKWHIKKINGADTLTHESGDPVECIYKTPVMLPHPQIAGQVVIKVTLCSEKCPNFQLDDTLLDNLTLCCTGIKISAHNKEKQENKMKLV